MTNTTLITGLQDCLRHEIIAAYDAMKHPLSTEDVANIIQLVIKSLSGDASNAEILFYSELKELELYIQKAKLDIVSIHPKDISTDYIPRATDELDAVVGATEEATNKIMDVCDEMSALASHCTPEIKEKLIACTTKIFEACNFQDITGQRITKVVETLKHIDVKIAAFVKILGDEVLNSKDDNNHVDYLHVTEPEKALLNGPQLPQNATSQDEIDRLLSSS